MVVCGSRELNKRRRLKREILSTDHGGFPSLLLRRRSGTSFQPNCIKVNIRNGRKGGEREAGNLESRPDSMVIHNIHTKCPVVVARAFSFSKFKLGHWGSKQASTDLS